MVRPRSSVTLPFNDSPPLTLVMDGTAPADAAIGSRWHGSVRAPKADGGGVGGLTFVRTELGWVIRTW